MMVSTSELFLLNHMDMTDRLTVWLGGREKETVRFRAAKRLHARGGNRKREAGGEANRFGRRSEELHEQRQRGEDLLPDQTGNDDDGPRRGRNQGS